MVKFLAGHHGLKLAQRPFCPCPRNAQIGACNDIDLRPGIPGEMPWGNLRGAACG